MRLSVRIRHLRVDGVLVVGQIRILLIFPRHERNDERAVLLDHAFTFRDHLVLHTRRECPPPPWTRPAIHMVLHLGVGDRCAQQIIRMALHLQFVAEREGALRTSHLHFEGWAFVLFNLDIFLIITEVDRISTRQSPCGQHKRGGDRAKLIGLQRLCGDLLMVRVIQGCLHFVIRKDRDFPIRQNIINRLKVNRLGRTIDGSIRKDGTVRSLVTGDLSLIRVR